MQISKRASAVTLTAMLPVPVGTVAASAGTAVLTQPRNGKPECLKDARAAFRTATSEERETRKAAEREARSTFWDTTKAARAEIRRAKVAFRVDRAECREAE